MMPYTKIFNDSSVVVDMLSDEEAGRLLKAILHYGNGIEDDVQGRESLVFAMLKQQIDRDITSYEEHIEKQRENGQKGGRPKKPSVSEKTQQNPRVISKTQKSQDKDKEEDKENIITPLKSPQGEMKSWECLLDPEIKDAWKEFEEHRKKMRKPMTDRARLQVVERVNQYGKTPDEQRAIIYKAIEMGWQTVYPLKEEKRKPALNYIQSKYSDEELLKMAVDLT